MAKKLTDQQAFLKMLKDEKGVMFCDNLENVSCDKKRKRFSLKFTVNPDMGNPAMAEMGRKVFGGNQKHIVQVMIIDIEVMNQYIDGKLK